VPGRGLNRAEPELSLLERQGRARRLEATEVVRKEVGVWATRRTAAQLTLNWRFPIAEARVQLKSVDPCQSKFDGALGRVDKSWGICVRRADYFWSRVFRPGHPLPRPAISEEPWDRSPGLLPGPAGAPA
jgi:hypothetical protein